MESGQLRALCLTRDVRVPDAPRSYLDATLQHWSPGQVPVAIRNNPNCNVQHTASDAMMRRYAQGLTQAVAHTLLVPRVEKKHNLPGQLTVAFSALAVATGTA
jgi:hypothetical protein